MNLKNLLFLLVSIFILSFSLGLTLVSADTGDYSWMGQMMYGSSGNYGMMSGILGSLMYLLMIVNLVLLAIFLYKKIRGMK